MKINNRLVLSMVFGIVLLLNAVTALAATGWTPDELFYEFRVGDFGYVIQDHKENATDENKNCAILTRYFGSRSVVEIPAKVIYPETGQEYNVTRILGVLPSYEYTLHHGGEADDASWARFGFVGYSASPFLNSPSVVKVILPETLEIIDESAFAKCSNLQSIELSPSVRYIGESAFEGCKTLMSVSPLTENLKTIAWWAFKDCQSLQSLDMSNCSVNRIEVGVFEGCGSLRDVKLPNSVSDIDYCAFKNCKQLIDIELPSMLENIGKCAFMGCSSLSEIRLPDKIEEIKDGTFENCSNLQTVHFNDQLRIVGGFANCISLIEIKLPDSVEEVMSGAFKNCLNLSSVELNDNVKSIGDEAFMFCSGVEEIKLPQSLTSLGARTFAGSGLTECNLPDGYAEVPDECYWGTNITTLSLPNSVLRIGTGAFRECPELESVTMSDLISQIENETFMACPKLTTVILPSELKSVGARAFAGDICLDLQAEDFPANLSDYGEAAFSQTAIGNLDLGVNVRYIRSGCFAGCPNLKSVEMRCNPQLGSNAFGECVSIYDGYTTQKTILDEFVCLESNLNGSATDNHIFTDETYSDCVLYLSDYNLKEKLSRYPWKLFRNVIPSGGLYVSEITESGENADNCGPIFNLHGERVSSDSLAPGLYIQNGRKLLVPNR